MTDAIRPTEGTRPEAIRNLQSASSGAGRDEPVQAVRPVDRVEISSEGRALAGETPVAEATGGKDAPSLDVIRQRIREGHYDTPAMAESVARRLLESGEL